MLNIANNPIHTLDLVESRHFGIDSLEFQC